MTTMKTRTKAKLHEFRLELANMDELTPALADAFYRIFDDATAGSCNGEVAIQFHRQGASFQQAVQSAIADIR